MSNKLIGMNTYLMGREKEYPLTSPHQTNAWLLLKRVNTLLTQYLKMTPGARVEVSSGYRPGKYNKLAGGSATSAHMSCEAVDILDRSRELSKWILAHPKVLITCDLYMENPEDTPSWVHLQIRPTKSGNRIFKP